MNAQTFLDNFGYIANAPEGVQRLIDLVLSLAFQGKIAERSDDDVIQLVNALEEAQSLTERKRRVTPNGNEGYHTIPAHWLWVNIAKIGHDWGQKKPDSDFTYIDVSAIDNKRGQILEDVMVVHPQNASSRARKIVQKGTVLYSTVRPYLLNITVVEREFDPAPIASTAFAIVHPYPGVLSQYVYYYLRSPAFISHVEAVQSGIAYPAISDQKFFAASFPLAPTDEQKRIVAKVDELMALCDKLEALQQKRKKLGKLTLSATLEELSFARNPRELQTAWKRLSDNLPSFVNGFIDISPFRKSVFDLAVTARLSQHHQDDTDVIETLRRISEKRAKLLASKEVKKSPQMTTPSPKDFPFEIPDHWKWVRLGELAKVIEYGTSQKAHQHPTGVPILRMGNIADGNIDYSNLKYVEENIKDLPKLYLNKNDLVFNRTNSFELVGKMGIFERDDDAYTLASYLIRITLFTDEVNPHYINSYFQSLVCRTTQIEPNITVQTNQANFNGTKLRNVLIPLPPYEEQARIVNHVGRLMAIVDSLHESLSAANETSRQLASEIIAAVAGIQIKEQEKMKAPKMELVSTLKVGSSLKLKDQAPLTSLLTKNKGELSAKTLWAHSGLKIDEFYLQLKTEMANGWIVEPEKAVMREVVAN